MSSLFLAKGTMELNRNGHRVAVIYGDVIEGTVQNGMLIEIPFNSSFSMSCEIEAVEYLDVKIGLESYIALIIKVQDDPEEEVELIMALNIGDEELKVVENS